MYHIPLPFQHPASLPRNFQYLEDLSTAYWYSEVLFAAIDLNIFQHIEKGHARTEDLAEASQCRESELRRFMRVLERMELVRKSEGRWRNSRTARAFLLPDTPDYMGDFLLYRRYMQSRWMELPRKLAREDRPPFSRLSPEDDYEERNFHYVRSTDRLMRQKVREILPVMEKEKWQGPVLDIGGGAGTLAGALIRCRPGEKALLFELPEVIRAARRIRPRPEDWEQTEALAGDFRFPPFSAPHFGLIVMSNFLHTYNPRMAEELLGNAVNLLLPGAMLLIHDFFPDRTGSSPHKGALYDLNMMLNTCDGHCHEAGFISDRLREAGMEEVRTLDLQTDTSLILAKGVGSLSIRIE